MKPYSTPFTLTNFWNKAKDTYQKPIAYLHDYFAVVALQSFQRANIERDISVRDIKKKFNEVPLGNFTKRSIIWGTKGVIDECIFFPSAFAKTWLKVVHDPWEAIKGYVAISAKILKAGNQILSSAEDRKSHLQWMKEHRNQLYHAFLYAGVGGIGADLPTCPVGGVVIQTGVDSLTDALNTDQLAWRGKGPGGTLHGLGATGLYVLKPDTKIPEVLTKRPLQFNSHR